MKRLQTKLNCLKVNGLYGKMLIYYNGLIHINCDEKYDILNNLWLENINQQQLMKNGISNYHYAKYYKWNQNYY